MQLFSEKNPNKFVHLYVGDILKLRNEKRLMRVSKLPDKDGKFNNDTTIHFVYADDPNPKDSVILLKPDFLFDEVRDWKDVRVYELDPLSPNITFSALAETTLDIRLDNFYHFGANACIQNRLVRANLIDESFDNVVFCSPSHVVWRKAKPEHELETSYMRFRIKIARKSEIKNFDDFVASATFVNRWTEVE